MLRGVAEGVTGAGAADDAACRGAPAETWTIEVEVSMEDEVLVGSVLRIPDALVAGDCFGLDLTLGLSGTRRG